MINTNSIISVQERMAEGVPCGRLDDQIAKRLWWAALDVIQDEILLPINPQKGLWLASPLPALYESKLLDQLQGWVWTPKELSFLKLKLFYLKLEPFRLRHLPLEREGTFWDKF